MKSGKGKWKRGICILPGIWCAITSFISPVWLTIVFMNISGLIYRYDYSIDEGIAGILGMMELIVWLFLVLLPDVFFLKYLKSVNSRCSLIFLGIMILLAVLCMALCKWNMVRFLTMPVGK